MKLSNCLRASQWPRRVLGISKLCALDCLKAMHPGLLDNQLLLDRLRTLSRECDEIIAEHHRQLTCERELAQVLRNLDVSYRITKRLTDASEYVHWADLMIAIGDDDTFLLAAKLITGNQMPIFGINPHPSIDNTFALPIEHSADIDGIFERLRAGDYELLMRSRIRTTMTGIRLHPNWTWQSFLDKRRMQNECKVDVSNTIPRSMVLPWLALNEIHMTEFLAARSITLAVQLDGENEWKFRSSGIYVCTGSGSHSRAPLNEINVQRISDIIQTVVAMAGRKLNGKETNELLHKYKKNFLFSPEDPRMAYVIYEMYRSTLSPKCRKSLPDRQRCRTMRVRSFGFDACLVLDGYVSLPFNDGTSAFFEIRPEYSLRSIVLR